MLARNDREDIIWRPPALGYYVFVLLLVVRIRLLTLVRATVAANLSAYALVVFEKPELPADGSWRPQVQTREVHRR